MLNDFIKDNGDLFSTQPQMWPTDVYQRATLCFLHGQEIPCVHTVSQHRSKSAMD